MNNTVKLEYSFKNTSPLALWMGISSPLTLKEWFAEKVECKEKEYVFYWNKTPHIANILEKKEGSMLKLHWIDSGDSDFFQYDLVTSELIGDTTLFITDTCFDAERDEAIMLWDTQIENMRRVLGT